MARPMLSIALLVACVWRTGAATGTGEELLAEIHAYASQDRPLENPKLFEGDILPVDGNLSYNAISQNHLLWPNAVIYYEVDYSLQSLVQDAIQDYHSKTCLRFKRGRGQGNYVKIFNGQGCYANVGMVGGQQPLSLGQGCHYRGTAVHELGHVAGFYHEHTRSDRDQHINLYLQNVDQQYYPQFQKLHPSENRLFNRFDYQSVMLYGSRSFSNNGQYSMTRKDGGLLAEVHDKHGLSAADVERVNKLYSCQNGQGGGNQDIDDGNDGGNNDGQFPWPPVDPWGGQWGGWGNAQPEGNAKPDGNAQPGGNAQPEEANKA